MAIAVTGYTILTDTDGNVSQSVTVPTGSDYCLAFLGSDNGPTINSISIGGQAMSLLVAGGGWALTNRLYGCPVTPGTRTFSLSTASPFNYLGAPGLIFLSGVGSVRASAGNGLSAIGTLSLADIMSQADDFAIIIGAHDGYSSPGAQDVELNGQTAIFENQNVNYGGFGAASNGSSANNALITFNVPSGSWGLITHMAIYDQSTNMLIYTTATPNQTPASGDTVQYAIGALTVTLD